MFLSTGYLVKNKLLPFLFVITISMSTASFIQQRKVWVTLINSLGPGSKLTTHCSSTEDDLGVHVLENGQTLGWHFRPNIWGTTKYRCLLQSQYSNGNYVVYSFSRDDDFCGETCVYSATPTGICLKNKKNNNQLCRQWSALN